MSGSPPAIGGSEVCAIAGLFLALTAALVALPRPAIAQDPSPNPDTELVRAQELIRSGDARTALEILEPRLAAESHDGTALYLGGLAQASLGRYPEALELFQRSLAVDPRSRARRELGLLLGRAGRLRDCLALLGVWFEAHPEDREAGFAAAYCSLELQRADDTRALLERLPADALPTRILRGRLLLFESSPREAIATLTPALEQATGTMELDIRRLTAEAYLALGEAARAVELLDGFERTPETARQLAEARFQSGDTAGAARTLAPWAQRLLDGTATEPGTVEAAILRELGRYRLQQGRSEEAVELLRAAASAQPNDKQAWDLLARSLAASGRADEATRAVAELQRLVADDLPESVKDRRAETRLEDPTQAALEEAVDLARAGRPDEAVELLEQEGRLATDDVRPWVVAARILLADGRPAEALVRADRGIEIEPDSPLPHRERGRALATLGRGEEAIAAFRTAVELRPDFVDALLDWAALETAAGRLSVADELLDRARRQAPDDPRLRQLAAELEAARERVDP